jgi:DNA-binding SARP family transcriptional activator
VTASRRRWPAPPRRRRPGDLQAALQLTRRQSSLDPLAEETQCHLIRRLAASGDRAAALSVYERFAERLRTELRTVPSAATRKLAEAVRLGAAATQTG